MRCLYCGKELALLKRWTGGGEFCSDAHRQQYQEEYNKLALNRLLQAQPTPEANPEPVPEKRKEAKPEPAKAKPEPKLQPKPEPVMQPVMAKVAVVEPPPEPEPEPELEAEPEQSGPVEPGFLVELPLPANAETRSMVVSEYEFVRTFHPSLPAANGHALLAGLGKSGQVELQLSGKPANYIAAKVERKLEVREFVRSGPKVEFDLRAAGEAGLLDTSEEPMEILIFPHPPQGSPPFWTEAEKDFQFEPELGALALVPFGTTGIEDNREDLNVDRSAIPQAPVTAESTEEAPKVEEPKAEEAKVTEPPKPEPPKVVAAPVVDFTPKPVAKAEPVVVAKPAFAVPPRIERTSKPLFVRPQATRPVFEPPVVEQPAPVAEKVEKKSEPVPQVATKPMPLTLHGLAAGRGKPVQVFTAAVSAGIDVEIPRSIAVPLRPVMVLGAAPVEEKKVEEKKVEEKRPDRTVVVKTEPKKGQNGRPDPRFANGKGRRQDVRISEPEPEKKEEKVAAAVATAVKEPAPEKIEKKPEPEKRVEPVKEAPLPKPLSAPYTPPDLGLPNLRLETSEGFWSKLPMAAKLGAAAVIAVAILGMVVMSNKGKSATAGSVGQVVEAGTPLAVVPGGWITDWGAEPGVRKVHEISVLRPSLTLTDYRLEFQAQIETKAIGWIYRAKDGKNYYVNRLEVVKPGLDPTIALVRFAVINGEEQPRAQFPLSLNVHVDTLYKVKFEAVGDRFTTWVQDQKIDEWTDSRIKIGGVGLYNERGERMSLKGSVNVVPLAIRR